jgi:hypothetical protein
MRALPNQMSESRHSRRFVPMASASAEGQPSDLLDPDQLVRGVPFPDLRRDRPRLAPKNHLRLAFQGRNYSRCSHTVIVAQKIVVGSVRHPWTNHHRSRRLSWRYLRSGDSK